MKNNRQPQSGVPVVSAIAGSRPHDNIRANTLAPIVMSAASLRLAEMANKVATTRAIAAPIATHHGAPARAVKPRPRKLSSPAAEPRRRKSAPAG